MERRAQDESVGRGVRSYATVWDPSSRRDCLAVWLSGSDRHHPDSV